MVGFILAWMGGRHLLKFYEEQRMQRLANFNPQLRQYLFLFRELLKRRNKKLTIAVNPAIVALSTDANYIDTLFNRNAESMVLDIQAMGEFAKAFLHFLRNAPNQMPDLFEEKIEYEGEVDILLRCLLRFELSSKGIRFDDAFNISGSPAESNERISEKQDVSDEEKKHILEEQICEYNRKLHDVIHNIEKMISSENKTVSGKTKRGSSNSDEPETSD